MKQILFNNATAVPAGAVVAPAAVAEGRVAAYNIEDMTTTLDLDASADCETVIFVQGTEAGKDSIFSPPVKLSDVRSVVKTAYSAPVAQVTTLTPTFTTTVPEGEGTIRLVRADAGFKPKDRTTVTVVFTGKTRQAIVDEFVTLINSRYPKFVTASRSGSTTTSALVLTANVQVSFETSTEDLAANFTLAATTTPVFGTGTATQVAALEEIAWGANVNNRSYLPNFPKRYAGTGNFDLYTIEFKTTTTPNISLGNTYGEIIIAVNTVSTGIDLVAFFGPADI